MSFSYPQLFRTPDPTQKSEFENPLISLTILLNVGSCGRGRQGVICTVFWKRTSWNILDFMNLRRNLPHNSWEVHELIVVLIFWSTRRIMLWVRATLHIWTHCSGIFIPLLVSPCRSYSPGRWRASWGRRRPPAAAPRPPGPGSSPACGRCFCSSSSAPCECLQPDSAADTEQLQDQTHQRQQDHSLFQAKTIILIISSSVLLSL